MLRGVQGSFRLDVGIRVCHCGRAIFGWCARGGLGLLMWRGGGIVARRIPFWNWRYTTFWRWAFHGFVRSTVDAVIGG